MDFLSSSEARLVFAFWLGVCVVIASLVLLVAILVIRQWVARGERIHRRAAEQWRKILAEAATGAPVTAPSMPRSEEPGFFDVWNELHDAPETTVAARAGMARVAAQVGLEDRLHRAIDQGAFHHRIMAIIAAGHLKSEKPFDKLARLLGDNSPIVSLSAARALMKIDPERAVRLVVPKIVDRNDWVDGGIAQMLGEAGPAVVGPELSMTTLQVNDGVASRLVRFLAGIDPDAAMPVIHQILAEAHDEHLVSTCLQVMSDGTELDSVRNLLRHPRWHVRMHAATAMGRFGGPQDAQDLRPLLQDSQWWVRYRSAQALRKLVAGREDLQRIRDGLSDRFARDILEHVMAEQALGAVR